MAIISIPAGVVARSESWRQAGGVMFQRSDVSGATKALVYGTAARWMCELDYPPTIDAQTRRGFFAAMRQGINTFRLPAVEAVQHSSTPTVLVNGSSSSGYNLSLKGLPASVPLLPAGGLITVVLPSGDEQMIALAAALAGNGSGQATAQLGTPLRETPANNAAVETREPWALMRAADPMAWMVEPGGVYRHALSAEEAF